MPSMGPQDHQSLLSAGYRCALTEIYEKRLINEVAHMLTRAGARGEVEKSKVGAFLCHGPQPARARYQISYFLDESARICLWTGRLMVSGGSEFGDKK